MSSGRTGRRCFCFLAVLAFVFPTACGRNTRVPKHAKDRGGHIARKPEPLRPDSVPPRPRPKFAARLALMVLMPLAVLIVLELGLRLIGFGYPTSFFIKREDGKTLGTNPHFGRRFHPGESATKPYPVVLPIQKAPNTRRIFVLGESAAQGTPAPSFGFARMLEAMLGQQFPDTKFEVVNAAMQIGRASCRERV